MYYSTCMYVCMYVIIYMYSICKNQVSICITKVMCLNESTPVLVGACVRRTLILLMYFYV